eukprot:4870676-Amphidinium_carterae.1
MNAAIHGVGLPMQWTAFTILCHGMVREHRDGGNAGETFMIHLEDDGDVCLVTSSALDDRALNICCDGWVGFDATRLHSVTKGCP